MLDLRPGADRAGSSVPDQRVTHTGSSCNKHLPRGGKNYITTVFDKYST